MIRLDFTRCYETAPEGEYRGLDSVVLAGHDGFTWCASIATTMEIAIAARDPFQPGNQPLMWEAL